MKNVYIYCEGPTEESFINEILYDKNQLSRISGVKTVKV